MFKKFLWSIICIIAAISLAVVTGIINPGEKVNALWVLTAAICIFAVSYRFYCSFIAAKVLCLDDKHETPANRLKDGVDYEPTNKWVLFGHHFAAIVGAGPLIGPMLAAQFGFLSGFLWILIGATLGGAVHDMVILTASVRKDGKSLAHIVKEEVGTVGGIVTSLAIILIIIIALAGLGLAVVNALSKNPWATYTVALTIPIALFMGIYLKNIRPNKIIEVSVIGIILLLFALISGHFVPGSMLAPVFTLSKNNLVISIMIYGFFASVLPVWLLLCPRDYLSTYMKIGTVLLLSVAIVIIAPDIQMPAVTKFIDGGGPIIPGKIFPFVFISIACGAISGFHSLISSGTTPKMIISEKHIPAIGFGAMLTEGIVAIIALIAATVLIPGDYFAVNTTLSLDNIEKMGFSAGHIKELSNLVGIDVTGRPGGAVSLAVGMSSILSQIPGMKGLLPFWYNFALLFEALFILTTVDAGTRVARFILQEFSGRIYTPFARQNWIPGIILTSLIVVISWGYLIHSGSVSTIWPVFGTANQLLAAIALGAGTTFIIKSGRIKYVWVTFVPMVFMFITTFTAAYQLIVMFHDKPLLAGLLLLISLLAIIILINMVYKLILLIVKKPDEVKDSAYESSCV